MTFDILIFLVIFVVVVVIPLLFIKRKPDPMSNRFDGPKHTDKALSDSIAKTKKILDGFDEPGPLTTRSKPTTNLVKVEPENNFEYENYYYNDGHTESEWESIGLKVEKKYRSTGRQYYTFPQTESKSYAKYSWLTPNQRKVKILGDALVSRTKSKRRAKDILVNQYDFKENTAKYAAGYEGYHDW
jgi:hypothetical protein